MKTSAIKIGDKFIGKEHPCFIIAEAGVNHNGDLEVATKMIDSAKKCAVDAIKFQTYKTEDLLIKGAPLAKYQKENLPDAEDQFSMIKKLEISYEDFKYLKEYTEEKGLIFLSSPFDEKSAEFLNEIDIDAFKIPSGEITNPFLLDKIASYSKPVILSTGMANLEEIEYGLNRFYLQNLKEIILLHCITSYPAKIEEANLNAMHLLETTFQHLVGLSDHTPGYFIPLMAKAKDAVVIEKHFTLDKEMVGPDHKASLDVDDMQELVKKIRLAEKALGTGEKLPTDEEMNIAKVVRKSLVSKRNIQKGEIFSKENLTAKRPGTGILARDIEKIIGKKAAKNIEEDSFIAEDMIQ